MEAILQPQTRRANLLLQCGPCCWSSGRGYFPNHGPSLHLWIARRPDNAYPLESDARTTSRL